MKFPWPLRYTIPGVILMAGLLLSAGSFLYEKVMAGLRVEMLVNRHAQFIGNQISGVAAHFLATDDRAGLRKQIAALGADPTLRHALVCDDTGKVLAASHFEFANTMLGHTPLAYAQERLAGAHSSATMMTENRRRLLGVFPFLLAPKAGELTSSRHGYLLLEFDLSHPKAQMGEMIIERALIWTAGLAVVCVLSWAFFHQVLNRRIQKLMAATEKLASGESPACEPLGGCDELARLSLAFERMRERIAHSTGELLEANERMKQEIAGRKFVEEALLNSERRSRSIWENSLEPLRLTDSTGTVIAVNSAFCRMVERADEEIVQHPYTDVYRQDGVEEKLAKYAEAFRTRQFGRYQAKRVTLHSGRILDLETSYSFIDVEDSRPLLLGVFRDVTEQKSQEAQRLALERQLVDSQKLESLGVLAGGIAHDFNNLLAAILGNANLAQMQLSPAETKIAAYLKNIEKTSIRAADLCKQMLAYSGKGRFAMQFLDVNEVVRETLELLEVSITKKAALRVELRHGVPHVHADATQLRQVVMNLVINASEAIGDKSGLIRVRTGVVQADANYFSEAFVATKMPPGEYVFVEVSDTGCGMSLETQKRIFEPFFTTKFTGRGLGLAAVLGIVRGHKGALKLTTEVDKGSAFKFILPLAAVPECAVAAPAPASLTPPWSGRGTILIVDDDPTVRAVMARMVESFGFDVLQAVDGRHGVEVFRENREVVDAVVLDMTMPNLDGREAFVQMRDIQEDVKVLLVSGFSEHGATHSFDGRGPKGFLQKPFKPSELKVKLRSILAKDHRSEASENAALKRGSTLPA